MLFATERAAARPKTAADLAPLGAVYGDPAVMRHLGGPLGTTAQRALLEQHRRHQEVHGFSMWTLVEAASGEVVGDVGFLVYEEGVEIGWHLRRSAWGRGLATEAARACLTFGFAELGFEHVSAFTESANAASLRVIAKLGMRLERGGAEGAAPWEEHVAER